MWKDHSDDVYANVLLKDGKIFFWKTGFRQCRRMSDFSKSFYFTGMKMTEEKQTGKFTVESRKMTRKGHDGYLQAKDWYKKWEIHPDSRGNPPYEVAK